jgi:hypothetical protein
MEKIKVLNLESKEDRKKLITKLNITEKDIIEALELKKKFFEKILEEIQNKKKAKLNKEYTNFVNKYLEHKYGRDELNKCAAYHIFSGSSFSLQMVDFWDFESEDSIIKKVKELLGVKEDL